MPTYDNPFIVEAMSESGWKLYYWDGFVGRGEFVRLMFEEAGVQYTEVNDREVIFNDIISGKGDGFPMFAPPMIQKGTYFNFELFWHQL